MPAKLLHLLLPMLLLAACTPAAQPAPATAPEPAPAVPTVEAPVRTQITDVGTFKAYIATRPTPEALRQRYPGLTVVMPGDISTRELRSDNSRYFVEVDAEGRVTGGQFQ